MQTNMEGGRLGATRKPYTDEFKRSVVEHWLESGKSARKVAEEFGIKQWNLRDWRYKFGPAPKGPDDPMPESPEALQRELQRLRKELARVTAQREILKKLSCLLVEAPRDMKIGSRWVEARADAKAAWYWCRESAKKIASSVR